MPTAWIPISKVPLEVTASSPTGIVFNPTTAKQPSDFVINQARRPTTRRCFLFNETFVNAAGTTREGRITGWTNEPAPALTTTSTDARMDPGFPTGLALVTRAQRSTRRACWSSTGVNGDPASHVFDSHFARR